MGILYAVQWCDPLMCDLMLLCSKVAMDQIELFTVSVFTCLSTLNCQNKGTLLIVTPAESHHVSDLIRQGHWSYQIRRTPVSAGRGQRETRSSGGDHCLQLPRRSQRGPPAIA